MANRLLGVISALPEEFAHLSDRSGQAQRNRRACLLARRDRRPRGGVRRIRRRQGQCRRRHRAAARSLRLPRADDVRRGGRPRSGAGRGRCRGRHQPHPARLRHAQRRRLPHHPARQPAVAGAATGSRATPWPSRWWRACARRCRARAGAAARSRRRRPAHPRHPFRRDPDRRQLRQFRRRCGSGCTPSSRRRRSRWKAAPWRKSRGAGATTFRSSTCAASATSPAARAISTSAPSCRSLALRLAGRAPAGAGDLVPGTVIWIAAAHVHAPLSCRPSACGSAESRPAIGWNSDSYASFAIGIARVGKPKPRARSGGKRPDGPRGVRRSLWSRITRCIEREHGDATRQIAIITKVNVRSSTLVMIGQFVFATFGAP